MSSDEQALRKLVEQIPGESREKFEDFAKAMLLAYHNAKPQMSEIAPHVEDSQGMLQAMRYAVKWSGEVPGGARKDYEQLLRTFQVLRDVAQSYHRVVTKLIEDKEDADVTE